MTEDDIDTLPPAAPVPPCENENRRWRDNIDMLVNYFRRKSELHAEYAASFTKRNLEGESRYHQAKVLAYTDAMVQVQSLLD